MNYKKCILISLFIHLIFMISLSGTGGSDTAGNSNKSINMMIIEKKDNEKPKDDKPKDGNIFVKQTNEQNIENIDCKDYYVGIGVMHSEGSCLVTQVADGYPAKKSGVLVGDLIVSPPCPLIRGPEGTTVNIKILRGSNVINLSMKRERICEAKKP